MELSQQQERELIKAGNETAFEIVFKRYYALLCNYAYTFVRDRAEAEELVQSAFLAFWEKRQSLDVHTSLKAYLFSMIRNASLNILKHKKVQQKHIHEESLSQERLAESASESVHAAELEKQIGEALEKLPEQCRLIFKMSRFEELKYAEIATELNLSVKTVENQIGKALRIMREQLRDYLSIVIVFLIDLLL